MKISIVIPIYNKAAYIRPCMESLLEQDFDDFEIVAVDDGSTDGSGDLCDELAQETPRIHVIHTPNGGVTAARRVGVEQAQGRYIVFVDSDDVLMPHALKTLYDTIEQTQADEVVGTFCTQDGTLSPKVYEGWTPVEPLIQAIITGKNRFPVLWGIIFRKELLEDCLDTPRDIIEGEDKLMQVKVLMKQPKVFFIKDCIYRYTLGLPNSRQHTLERERLYDDLLRQGRIDVEVGERIAPDDSRFSVELLARTKEMRHHYEDRYRRLCLQIETGDYWRYCQHYIDKYTCGYDKG